MQIACRYSRAQGSPSMFCEHCGLQIFPNRPVCTRCGESPTLHWLQFTSLLTLLIAVVCNSLLAWYLLPRFTASHHAPFFFRAWLWTSEKASLYGWAPVAAGLLAWDYFIWRKSRPKVKGWFTRKVLTLSWSRALRRFCRGGFQPVRRRHFSRTSTHCPACLP